MPGQIEFLYQVEVGPWMHDDDDDDDKVASKVVFEKRVITYQCSPGFDFVHSARR